MFARRLLSTYLAIGFVLWAGPAATQGRNGANIELNPFRPAIDSRGYITVNASQVLGHKEVSFGIVTNWGRNLLVFEDGDKLYEVINVISPTLVGAFGLKLGPAELEFGLSMPFSIMSGDRSPDDDNNTPADPNDDENFQFDGQGTGDLAIHLKTRFLKTSRGPKIGFAVIGSVFLPTASEKDKWIGEDSVVPQVMAVLDKEFGEQSQLRLAISGGIRLRLDSVEFVDNTTGTDMLPVTGGRVESGPSVPLGAAIAYAISPQKFDVVAEVFGALPLSGENLFPLESIVGIKLYLAKNSFFMAGGGVGLLRNEGANPDVRAFLGIVYEPNIGDRDGDGIKDDVDQCPASPEDYDDFEDEDGCPETDNDGDGILDGDDECPLVPEDKDGFEDEDGCPEGNELDRDGDGILDDDDECPDDPEDLDGFQDEDGCPEADNDGDGILDRDDLCPDDPEDMDSWEDDDGCPDTDNDNDRIVDEDDKCPLEPETYNGSEDDDGCPDRGRVVVTDTNIEILDKVYFEFNKAVIKSESFPILDAVAATLLGNPDILLIEIQGHTDSRGSDSYNLRLSDSRANAVREYLLGKEISPDRLQSQGYGETQPIDRRRNEAAFAKNRRVEFLILKRSTD
ncbi:MAG: OmpA family protein [Proteobacteria bacterium]|nr:OmpA family protein [Pseudomonadota bacterium]